MNTELLSAEDVAILSRLFGPRIPDEVADLFEAAKSVDVQRGVEFRPALDMLLRAIVSDGIGSGFCGGWRLRESDDLISLEVCRFMMAEAA